MKKTVFILCCVFSFLVACGQSPSPAPPLPGSDYDSYRVAIYLPKSDIWVDRMICGSTVPADVLLLFTSQGKGTIIIYDCIWISSGNSLQHGAPRKYMLEGNGQFMQMPPGFQWKYY